MSNKTTLVAAHFTTFNGAIDKAVKLLEVEMKESNRGIILQSTEQGLHIFSRPEQFPTQVYIAPRKKETRGWTKNNRHK